MAKKLTKEEIEFKNKQIEIRKKYEYLLTTDKLQSDFVLAQTTEICDYLNKLSLMPFPAWRDFIKKSINYNKEDFLYKFYLQENEFGIIEPDEERIAELKLQDLITK